MLGGLLRLLFGPIRLERAHLLAAPAGPKLQSLTQYWRFVLGAILALIAIAFPKAVLRVSSPGFAPACSGARPDGAVRDHGARQVLTALFAKRSRT